IDPVTGEQRPIDDTIDFSLKTDFRHDLPGTSWAWGFQVDRINRGSYYRIFEFGANDGLRKWGQVYVENKDVLGLTLRASYWNILRDVSRTDRVLYEGPRGGSPVLFTEKSDRELLPSF